jgi:hypothetical protein
MDMRRLLRHLMTPQWWVLRAFDGATLDAIEQAVATAEQGHHGELRFVVEGLLPLGHLIGGATARERAAELFAKLRVWDTERNSGILIYIQMADRCVEILADRGISARVPQEDWDELCRILERSFAAGDYRDGAVSVIGRAGRLLVEQFPTADNPDEMPDRPMVV